MLAGRATGEFCDLVLADARASNTSVDCSDCMLGVFAAQLSSPIGYSDDFAADFSSVTASCGASGYDYTTPSPYGRPVSATATAATTAVTAGPLPAIACAQTYTVAAGDSCTSISQAQGVSTYDLISRNGLDIFCSQLPSQLCLPGACQTHRWTGVDSCARVAAQYNVTMASFLSWNPIFDPYSTNGGPRWTNWTVRLR